MGPAAAWLTGGDEVVLNEDAVNRVDGRRGFELVAEDARRPTAAPPSRR
jgi:hypothetical protein